VIDALNQVWVPSKSELQRYSNWRPAQDMRELINSFCPRITESEMGVKMD
jgi:hypothetical protein